MAECTCYKCGIVFGMPDHYETKRREDGESFWCPNGHSQHYGEGSNEKLRRENQRLLQRQAELQDERREAERLRDLAVKREGRLKKRIAGGVCPCCHRTVAQMANHMKTKHPGYVKDNVVALKQPA